MAYLEDNKENGNQHKSTLVSRNITVLGRRTSVRLEPEMWQALQDIARRERCKIHDICSLIHMRKKKNTSLTAAIRVFLMLYFRAASTEEGHVKAGHGNFKAMLDRARMTREKLKNIKEQTRYEQPVLGRQVPPAPIHAQHQGRLLSPDRRPAAPPPASNNAAVARAASQPHG